MKRITLKKVKNRLWKLLFKEGKISYAQSGEDLILNNIFLSKQNGVYIDVGANHPYKASNTYFFYKMGWKGINIDALPDAIKLLEQYRKRDINIEAGISDVDKSMNFYMFEESSYNTFNEKLVDQIKKISPLKKTESINLKSLSSILSQYNLGTIDFISIDVEGLDLNVLKSNNWNVFRPKVVVVEDFKYGMDIENSEIYKYLISLEYIFFCRSVTNAFYIEQGFFKERFKLKK